MKRLQCPTLWMSPLFHHDCLPSCDRVWERKYCARCSNTASCWILIAALKHTYHTLLGGMFCVQCPKLWNLVLCKSDPLDMFSFVWIVTLYSTKGLRQETGRWQWKKTVCGVVRGRAGWEGKCLSCGFSTGDSKTVIANPWACFRGCWFPGGIYWRFATLNNAGWSVSEPPLCS